ncbi:MAG: hypothetical protein E6Z67_08505 [Haemophilus parainfluenzae]|nr:hypothetical protein [Haemophilus parainfluenzae]
MRLIATVLAVGLLSACTQGYYVKHRSPISVSKHVKRLNTTVCHDKDDWYLDGYRVGKDFQAQSQSQLNKRINYCGRFDAGSNGVQIDIEGYDEDALLTYDYDDDDRYSEDEEE